MQSPHVITANVIGRIMLRSKVADIQLLLPIIFLFYYDSFTGLFKTSFNDNYSLLLGRIFIWAIFYPALAFGLIKVITAKTIKRKELIVLSIIIYGSLAISYALFPLNREIISIVFPTIGFAGIIGFALIRSKISSYQLLESLHKFAYISFGISIVELAFFHNKLISESIADTSYNMDYSYRLLLPAILFLYFGYKKKVILDILFFVSSILVILFFGARGPLIGILVFTLFLIITKVIKTNHTIIFLFTTLLIALIAILVFTNMEGMLSSFLKITAASRSLNLISGGDVLYLSQRDILYTNLWNEITSHPISGLGIGGDRVVIYNKFGKLLYLNNDTVDNSMYAHNFFIEIAADFGLIEALLMTFWLLYWLIKVFNKKGDNLSFIIFLITFSRFFIPLLFSSSYLNIPGFLLVFGTAINYLQSTQVFSHRDPFIFMEKL